VTFSRQQKFLQEMIAVLRLMRCTGLLGGAVRADDN